MTSDSDKNNNTNPIQGDELKMITESLYRQSFELSVKNKILSHLSQLYSISILDLTPSDLAQKLSTTIQESLEFDFVGIFLYDSKRDIADSLGIALGKTFNESEKKINYEPKDFDIKNISKNRFVSKIINNNEAGSAEIDSNIWTDLKENIQSALRSNIHIKTFVIYPLTIQDDTTGLFILGLNRLEKDLAEYEKESIKSFINVISVALNKSLLDQETKDLNRRLKSVNSILSHDVKGVLGKNKDMFRMLLDGDGGEISPAMKPFLELSFMDTNKLIGSVLTILAAGYDLALKPESFDLKQAVIEEVERVKKDAEFKKIALSLDIEDDKFDIFADKNQIIVHVLRNLIENAVNYNIPGGSVAITLSRKDDTSYLFSVKDTGVGITIEDQKNLFKEGGHGKESIKYNVHSSGYGLSSAKKTVDAHGGKIYYETEVGKGTNFHVELPIITKLEKIKI